MTLPIPGPNIRRNPADLLAQIPRHREELPRSTVKLAVIEIIAVILSGAAGYFYLLYLAGRMRSGPFVAALAVFFIVSFLGTLFGPSLKHRSLIIVLEAAAFLVFFYDRRPAFFSTAFAAMVLFSLWGERQSRGELVNMLKFRFLRCAHVKMAKMLTGVLLGAMLLFLPQWREANVFISEGRFERYYSEAANQLNRVYSKLDFTSSVGEFAKNLARLQLAADPSFAELPPDEQDRALQAAAQEFIENAERNLGIKINADMSIGQAAYKYLANLFNGWKEKFGGSFLVLWAITVFVIARSVGAGFIWITMYAAYFFYQALVAWNVIDLEAESTTREKPLLT